MLCIIVVVLKKLNYEKVFNIINAGTITIFNIPVFSTRAGLKVIHNLHLGKLKGKKLKAKPNQDPSSL